MTIEALQNEGLTVKGHDKLIEAEQTLFDSTERYAGASKIEWHDWQSKRLKKRER